MKLDICYFKTWILGFLPLSNIFALAPLFFLSIGHHLPFFLLTGHHLHFSVELGPPPSRRSLPLAEPRRLLWLPQTVSHLRNPSPATSLATLSPSQ